VAAGAAGIDIGMSLTTPDARTINAVQSSGVFELQHCPTTSGEHVAHVAAPAGKSFTVAAVDCPPEREVYKDDPKKNGRDLVTAAMKKLEKSGCRDVVMAKATLHGKQSYKLKMQRGGYCINVLAASGVPGNAIELLLESPVGDAVAHSGRAAEVTLEHCATTSGEHSLSVVPAVDHYFTIAAMDCPRGHARK
jgi:hypothetical protein